jgi:sodium transport system ATP-binding protein
MIHVRQLTKAYDDAGTAPRPAVDRISFDALPGQIYGLLGPNGAGKTTTLRILSTILRATSGTVVVNGLDATAHPELVRRQIGFVSVNTAIYDRMTAWEMVHFFGRLNQMPAELLVPRIEWLFERLKMTGMRDQLGSRMSTGMKQKVSIARALVHDPPVLVFDEPTSGLDVLAARELFRTIEDMKRQGKCIVYSSHIMSEVDRLCDAVAIMLGGRIVAHGSPKALREEFAQPALEDVFYHLIDTAEQVAAAETAGTGR